ncbi:hypothetical protein DPMN_053290 [Dreissena polymorpha]|uniref:Uncharacterized protein n=1 Tax=Dreissena polymorpha TaxID=45954 RepID=A0A9D4CNG5_DREPO|nr:hypothetical protein DPMN_053290 [Dreissena polymorpha]
MQRRWNRSFKMTMSVHTMNYQSEDDTDEAVVHKTMGILRRRIIENNPKLDDFFYAPEEIKLSDQKQFVGPLLYKAVCLLHDKNATRKLLRGP